MRPSAPLIERGAIRQHRRENDPHCFGHAVVTFYAVLRLVAQEFGKDHETIARLDQQCRHSGVASSFNE
jgi:hypothetical protein